eukprot:2811820-Amphidinium_carterae.1
MQQPLTMVKVGVFHNVTKTYQRTYTDVPRDGDCYWHALRELLVAHNYRPANFSSMQVKREVINFMHDQAAHCAHVDQHTPQEWQTRAQAFAVDHCYADTPCVLAASMLYGVNQAIVSPITKHAELICVQDDPQSSPLLWLKLENEHYWYSSHLDATTPPELLQGATAMTETPHLKGGGGSDSADL